MTQLKLIDTPPNPLAAITVGAIFVNVWGYEQTNADFYQVVKRSPKSVLVREIEGRETPKPGGFMTGMTKPMINRFKGPPQRKLLQLDYMKEPSISFKHGSGSLYEHPISVSHYA